MCIILVEIFDLDKVIVRGFEIVIEFFFYKIKVLELLMLELVYFN